MVLQQDEAKRCAFFSIWFRMSMSSLLRLEQRSAASANTTQGPSVTKDGAIGTKNESKFHKDFLTDSLLPQIVYFSCWEPQYSGAQCGSYGKQWIIGSEAGGYNVHKWHCIKSKEFMHWFEWRTEALQVRCVCNCILRRALKPWASRLRVALPKQWNKLYVNEWNSAWRLTNGHFLKPVVTPDFFFFLSVCLFIFFLQTQRN